MRWLLAVGGALALLAGSYLALRPRWSRPVLRVGLYTRVGSADDAAIAAGVRQALDERDERGGRFRVAVVPHPIDGRGVPPTKAGVKLFLGLDVPGTRQDEGGTPLIDADPDAQAQRIMDWAKARGLRRVAPSTSARALKGPWNLARALEEALPSTDLLRPPEGVGDARWIAEARPDLVVLDPVPGLVDDLRAGGYGGPIFLSSFTQEDLKGLDGCLAVLSPLKPAPPEFRHPNPFAYLGYRAALRLLDAMDAAPGVEPEELCIPQVLNELLGEPRVYEVRGGRFVPK